MLVASLGLEGGHAAVESAGASGLQRCAADLQSCRADVQTCESTRASDLQSCRANVQTCESTRASDLQSCRADVQTCESTRASDLQKCHAEGDSRRNTHLPLEDEDATAGEEPIRIELLGGHGRRVQALSAHAALMALYEAAGGRNWTDKTGWSADAAP